MNITEDWTDDMNIRLVGQLTLEQLVEALINEFKNHTSFDEIYETLIVNNVSEFDREIVLDRAIDGIVRALTGSAENRPDQAKDPIAFKTFTEVWNSFETKDPISKEKIIGGFWVAWDHWRQNLK